MVANVAYVEDGSFVLKTLCRGSILWCVPFNTIYGKALSVLPRILFRFAA